MELKKSAAGNAVIVLSNNDLSDILRGKSVSVPGTEVVLDRCQGREEYKNEVMAEIRYRLSAKNKGCPMVSVYMGVPLDGLTAEELLLVIQDIAITKHPLSR